MLQRRNNVRFVSFDIFKSVSGLVAAVSARAGGVSSGEFASLNMSFSTGDAEDNVRENRRRFLRVLGIEPSRIISCNQVHGVGGAAVGAADCGRGAVCRDDAIDGCDILMTDEDHVPLTMNFADCTPLLFCDPVRHVIAVSHGGWRGTAENIGAVTLRRMQQEYGTKPQDVLAAIGPAIGACCFEVGQDVVDAFSPLFSGDELCELVRTAREGKYYFDLPKANRRLLIRAGIAAEHVEESHLCTYCRDDLFFSYRKAHHEGRKTGRHMAVIAWTDGDGRNV